jgi:hypothetical protein
MRENGSTTSSKSPERFRHETEQAYPLFDGDKEVSYGRMVRNTEVDPRQPIDLAASAYVQPCSFTRAPILCISSARLL